MRDQRCTTLASLALAALLAGCTATNEHASPQVPGPTSAASQSSTATSRPTPPPTTTSDAATSATATSRSITVVMNGDILLHDGLWATAEMDARRTGRGTLDFRPILADMRPVVRSADLAICHLETPLAPRGGPYSGYPRFSVPPQILPALRWEGYDACTTASNHSLDDGFTGIKRTLADFDRMGLAHFGTAVTKHASRTPLVLDVSGVRVGLIAATYGTNGIPIPSAEPWSVPIIDIARIERMAAKAKARGADVVLVALHWGLEYDHAPTQDQIDVADALTKDPDITLVYGHHAHVVQPYDKVNGTWVVYGLGNAVAQQHTRVQGVYDGNTCRVTFTERADGSFGVSKLEYLPTMITHYDGVHPMRWLDVPKDLRDPAFAARRPALRATQARVAAAVDMLGALRHGVSEAR
jgi:poly-gamma-glutamate capsule biosynthesis protein CapA/YwtB (metallophosphatase superfamily)